MEMSDIWNNEVSKHRDIENPTYEDSDDDVSLTQKVNKQILIKYCGSQI